jgi:hypothetical protein
MSEDVARQMALRFDVLHEQYTDRDAEDSPVDVAFRLPLADDYLAAVAERARIAQPGPWLAVARDDGEDWSVAHFSTGGEYDKFTRLWAVTTDRIHASESNAADGKDNALFIAHARVDIPLLLLEIERLRGLLAKRWER